MRKVLKQYQNNGKALEVRLEEESTGTYYVILAGMTLKFRTGCSDGRCESGDDYFADNETYMVHSFLSFHTALQAYETIKGQYVDYSWLKENAPVAEVCAR